MDNMDKVFKKDQFANYIGIELIDVSEGGARVKMQVEDCHLNSLGIVHGGALFSLADLAFAMASNSHGNVAVAINASISYMKAVSRGNCLFAEATEVSRNFKLASYTIRVTDEHEELIAIFQGMVYRKKDKIDFE